MAGGAPLTQVGRTSSPVTFGWGDPGGKRELSRSSTETPRRGLFLGIEDE